MCALPACASTAFSALKTWKTYFLMRLTIKLEIQSDFGDTF